VSEHFHLPYAAWHTQPQDIPFLLSLTYAPTSVTALGGLQTLCWQNNMTDTQPPSQNHYTKFNQQLFPEPQAEFYRIPIPEHVHSPVRFWQRASISHPISNDKNSRQEPITNSLGFGKKKYLLYERMFVQRTLTQRSLWCQPLQQCISPRGNSLPCCSSHSGVCRTSERTDQKPQIHYGNTKILTNNILKI